MDENDSSCCANDEEQNYVIGFKPNCYADVENVDIELPSTSATAHASNDHNDSDGSSDYETQMENIVEKVEGRRYSDGELDKSGKMSLLRGAVSDGNIKIVGGISKFKSKIENRIRNSGKICKHCFMESIQSHLSKLGIVTPSNKDNFEDNQNTEAGVDLLDHPHSSQRERCRHKHHPSVDNAEEITESPAGGNSVEFPGTSNLLQNLHRRTLSEIDWHELTRFAQGELFDPESSTAREIKRVIEEGKDELSVAFKMMQQVEYQMEYVVEEAEKCVQCVLNTGWRVVSHWELPQWLRDNDFLWHMHRPQLPSLKECFFSMFRIHTETGNIWTHFAGLILILIAMLVVYLRAADLIVDYPRGVEENIVFTAFFVGAICCLGFSWLFHTCSCHSKKTSSFLSKLDYAGIAFMIMGSFTPCVYYSFYCLFYHKVIYLTCILILGTSCIIIALWDKFATPAFRAVRAGVFLALGCSGIIPIIHMMFIHGMERGSEQGAVGWLIVMGLSYIIGAILYALRVPERFFPGKCNLVFQSHQIFHVLVVIGAFLHLHGCCQMAAFRVKVGRNCSNLILPTGNPLVSEN